MFGFLNDMGNYADRSVRRADYDWGFISTVRVSDGNQPFETAVRSTDYAQVVDLENTSSMVIVEAYDDVEAAEAGHDKWVKIMTEDPPDNLTDCLNAGITIIGNAVGCDFTETRIKPNNEPN